MADRQVRTFIGLKDLHHPLYGGDIQIIGRLIEDDKVWAIKNAAIFSAAPNTSAMVKESCRPRSWSRYMTSGAENVPEDGAIWWDRTLARVDFPEPLSPIIPVTESGIVAES